MAQAAVPIEVLADAMHSAAAEILVRHYGPAGAVARLRLAADLVAARHPAERQH